jgi:hypothetical protein
MVTASVPFSAMAEMAALMSASRRSGSIPILGMKGDLGLIDWSINKKCQMQSGFVCAATIMSHFFRDDSRPRWHSSAQVQGG